VVNKKSSSSTHLAVVGMAGRFPGAPDVDSLWHLLMNCGDAIRPVPPERWDSTQQLDPEKSIQAVGGFIEDVDKFDPTFFGISPREAEALDPQQRLMLETSWVALEDAGQRPERLAESRTGVYVGASWHDYEILRKDKGAGATQHTSVGNALDVVAARVSYFYKFKGPSLTVETGCSSGMVALHLACNALITGEIEGAIVGGVNLILAPDVSIGLTQFGGLSANGRCSAFSASADGFVRGEGVVALYIKTLDKALADGDRIHSVIVGTAVNNDGGGDSLVTPSPAGQEDLLRTVYAAAGVGFDDVVYVEAHGTGTPVGDPIEAGAIGRVIGQNRDRSAYGPLAIGSVKTNIGHLEATSGLAGFVKALLAISHRMIPPNLHADVLNPAIAFDELGLEVVREPRPLPAQGPFYVGVNSFGWGGTNAHAILAPAPVPAKDAARVPMPAHAAQPVMLPLSAHNDVALKLRAGEAAKAIRRGDASIAEIAGTFAWHRGHFDRRAAFVTATPKAIGDALEQFSVAGDETAAAASGVARTKGKVAFVFPGQGSQWAGMGTRLMAESPTFARVIARCGEALGAYVDWDLAEIMAERAGDGWTDRVDVVQPILWATSVALAEMWREGGINPDVVIGHSQGEIAAATVAGILSYEDAACVIARRSSIIRQKSGKGLMLAVDLDLDGARAAIEGFEGQISVAVNNGPRSCVLSGDADAIMTLKELLDAEETFNRLVRVDYASHSHHMDEFKETLAEALSDVRPRTGDVVLFSTVEARRLDGLEMDAAYWVKNLREPVLFADAMAALFKDGVTHVIEISPHKALGPAIEQLAALEPGVPAVLLFTMLRDQGSFTDILNAFARAYTSGLEPFAMLPRDANVAVGAYPWQRESYWVGATRRRGPLQAGLDVVLLPAVGEKDAWEGMLDIGVDENPWLQDHKVHEAVVFPGAAMMALAVAAGCARNGVMPRVLSAVKFAGDLTLGEEPVRVAVTLRDDMADGGSVTLRSLPAGATAWMEHATARVEQRMLPIKARAFPNHLRTIAPLDSEAFYRVCAVRGLHYGPAFQGVRHLYAAPDEVLGEILLPRPCHASARAHSLHPALWDAALQVSLALCKDGDTVVPTAVRKVMFLADAAEPVMALWSHAVRRSANEYDLFLFSADETLLAVIEGLTLEPLSAADAAGGDAERMHRLKFIAHAASEPETATGVWAVCGASEDGAEALATALTMAGATVRRMFSEFSEDAALADDITAIAYVAPRAEAGLEAQKCGLLTLAAFATATCALPEVPRMAIVTANAQRAVSGDKPDAGSALYWGFARVLRREHPELRVMVVDNAIASTGWAAQCTAELLAKPGEDQVALRDVGRLVGRLVQGRMTCDETAGDTPAWTTPAQPFRVVSSRPGFWDGLEYRALQRQQPRAGEIEIAVAAAALNFIDVMKVMGTYPGLDGKSAQLGGECSGRVVAVGPEVTAFAEGDRVVACTFGTFASHVTVRADHARRIPDAMGNAEAAALPLVMATAWYGLVDLGDLSAGETVLIHSATGGLGLAAIEVARLRGANIIATAGSPEKRAKLREMGIEHVFDSRDLSWVEDVRAATSGRGVDVVLNSLTGMAIPLGLESLAPDGRLIEVGKKDIYGGRSINLAAFKNRLQIAAVDLAGLIEKRPERFGRLFTDVWSHVESGALSPLPVASYNFVDAAEALRTMARGNHVGKFVLVEPETVRSIAPEPMPAGRFRADATYLITGGLGALGLSLAAYMVERGAGGIALLGRSAPSADARPRIAALIGQGARVETFSVDVSDAAALGRVLETVRETMPELRGIVHAAGLLDDALVTNLRADQVARVIAPKVDGAHHLDALTTGDRLDLFVMFSSAAALFGNAGQAAYASANAFLDALAERRRAEGRPALSVQWGPFSGIGLAAQDDARGARLEERGMGSFTAAEAWAALTRFLEADDAVVGYVPINLRQWFEAYPDTAAQPSWEILREAAKGGTQTSAAQDFRAELEATPETGRRDLTESKVRDLAGRVLRLDPKSFDRETPFKALGLDSLLGLELRNRLEPAFGLKLSPTLLWTYGNVRALSSVLCERVFAAAA
jgi:phthiocerol/phenolphthiocerol synthesis type-I polyketide synthase C